MKVKELLTDESKWCKGTMARTRNDRPALGGAVDQDACSWCLLGAIYKCYRYEPEKRQEIYTKLATSALITQHYMAHAPLGMEIDITKWNDAKERTFEEVKKLVNELDF